MPHKGAPSRAPPASYYRLLFGITWEVAFIKEVHAILITGRTLRQGIGVAEGKDSDVYRGGDKPG
jgi:hypothetical protein